MLDISKEVCQTSMLGLFLAIMLSIFEPLYMHEISEHELGIQRIFFEKNRKFRNQHEKSHFLVVMNFHHVLKRVYKTCILNNYI